MVGPLQGKSFGEAVLDQHKLFVANGGTSAAMAALWGLMEEVDPQVRQHVESFLDDMGRRSQGHQFWRQDAEEAVEDLARAARLKLQRSGVLCTDEDAAVLATIAFMNFAYTLVRQPSGKAFIQDALGVGFFRRLLS